MSTSGRVRLAGGLAIAGAMLAGSALGIASLRVPVLAATRDPTPTPSPSDQPTATPTPTDNPPSPTPAPTPPSPPPPPTTAAATPRPPSATARPLVAPPPAPTPTRSTAAGFPSPKPSSSPSPAAGVLGVVAPTAQPSTAIAITPLSGGAPSSSSTVTSVADPQYGVFTEAGLGGTAMLLGAGVAWRVLRPRRRGRLANAGGAALLQPETPLMRSWRTDLEDIADLAVLTLPPEEREVALQRRLGFRADELARRLVRSVEQLPEGF